MKKRLKRRPVDKDEQIEQEADEEEEIEEEDNEEDYGDKGEDYRTNTRVLKKGRTIILIQEF